MAFLKTARVALLGSWSIDQPKSLRRTAGLEKHASYFLQNAGSVDVEAALADVAEPYCISKNPRDYLFIPVRANSVDVPNENGDGFSRTESLRFNHKLGRRIYQTYLLKPHHINHRADNPRMARGFVVDVHFNEQNEMPEDWRKRYEAATGITLPRDIFVEALLGVDKSKDPYLGQGLESGVINAFSMGCECGRTRCNVCGNIATKKTEFCPHIRGGNKNKWFRRPDGRLVQGFEWCEDVVYGELSAVDQPADPRALSAGDVFRLHASLADGRLTEYEKATVRAFLKHADGVAPTVVHQILVRALGLVDLCPRPTNKKKKNKTAAS